MSCLSIFETQLPTRCVANPIFIVSPIEEPLPGDRLEFEVFEADADILKSLLGKRRYFVVDGRMPMWAELKELRHCVSSSHALLRDKPTLHGALSVFGEAVSKQ